MKSSLRLSVLSLSLALAGMQSWAAADEDDALELKVDDPPKSASAASQAGGGLKLAVELAALNGRRVDDPSVNGHRAALDLRYETALAPGWRLGLSDRLDQIVPSPDGRRNTRNHLREAFVAWQSENANTGLSAGRINLRHGSAYGYNPSDFFRQGATQSLVTADPIALRQNRTGTFMVRGTRSWGEHALGVALAPRLTRSGRGGGVFDLGLDGTNAVGRLVLSTSWKLTSQWSGESLLQWQEGSGAAIAGNFSGLVGDAVVLHGEWANAPRLSLAALAHGLATERERRRNQLAAGMTVAAPQGISVTTEWEYNGAGLHRDEIKSLSQQSPTAYAGVLASTQQSQELLARQAWLVYVTKKSAFLKQLDLAAFVRQNHDDHSRLLWGEVRYHWPTFDLALQWQQSSGAAFSEYRNLPYTRLVQVLLVVYR